MLQEELMPQPVSGFTSFYSSSVPSMTKMLLKTAPKTT